MLRVLLGKVPTGALGGSLGESFQRNYAINLQWQAGVSQGDLGGRETALVCMHFRHLRG